ncbi:MAG: hypothetical protein M1823_004132 [Watsoniomyces obsoletus]|nr:MAG: hypothetical protein M1823_004132 [Watsoniomyces obsoletus]
MAAAVGSSIVAITALLTVSGLVLLLLRHFLPLRASPAYLLVPVFLALALPASLVLLVPVDLASTVGDDERHATAVRLPEAVLVVAWRLAYWLCFALTWLILPLLGEYVDSGERSWQGRWWYSVRSNARYYAIVLGCCAVGLVYLFWQQGVHVFSLKAVLVALAYWWGLALAIFLMGHGLVAIPRGLIQDASPMRRLRRMQERAPKIYDRREDALQSVEELEGQVKALRQRKGGIHRDLKDWIDDLAEEVDHSGSADVNRASYAARGGPSIPTVVTERYLADLTRRLTRARHRKVRFMDSWNHLVKDAVRTQAIVDATASKQLSSSSSHHRYTPLTPYTRYLLHAHFIPLTRYLLGGIFALASISIIWSEMVKLFSARLLAISLTVLSHPTPETTRANLRGQIVAASWLIYMCAATLTSINQVKVWGNRALVRRNTYPESACWYASQVAKLTAPLAYHFLTFLPEDIHRQTAFYHFLGRLIDLTPLGRGFSQLLPLLILLPVCATLFGWYGRVGRFMGLSRGSLGDDEEAGALIGSNTWQEGRDLIERDLNSSVSTGQLGVLSTTTTTSRSSTSQNHSRNDHPQRSNPVDARRNPARGRVNRPPQYRDHDEGGERRRREENEEEDTEESNVFTEFAHRVRNTFDVTDRPRWMKDLGEGFKIPDRPRWMMSGDDRSGNDADRDSNDNGDASFLRRLFGGDDTNRRRGGPSRSGDGRRRNPTGGGVGGPIRL